MLAIHWSPVKNTEKILKNGLIKSRNGLYCFPLTGHRWLDTWWIRAFNQWSFRRNRNRYNGFIFRITEQDLPAYFGHWVSHTTKDTFQKPITTLDELEKQMKDTILWGIGLMSNEFELTMSDEQVMEIARKQVENRSHQRGQLLGDLDFMGYVLEDNQIILSKSIPPHRIIKVVPDRNEFGKVLYKDKKFSISNAIE